MKHKEPISAEQVRSLLSSSLEDASRRFEIAGSYPTDRAATEALVAGLDGRQWRVVMGCAEALGQCREGHAVAVAGLSRALNHQESSVRSAAAKSLQALVDQTTVPPQPLWDAYLSEEDSLTAIAVSKALVACLSAHRGELPTVYGQRMHSLLTAIMLKKLHHLPLGGTLVRRSPPPPPPGEAASQSGGLTGLLRRLLGQRAAEPGFRPDPPPRRPSKSERCFLTWVSDRRAEDRMAIIGGMAAVYAAVPADADARFQLMLALCKFSFTYRETTDTLVVLAGRLADTRERQAALLQAIADWRSDQDKLREAAMGRTLAHAYPHLRLAVFRRLLELKAVFDWRSWPYLLREASPEELGPLVEAALEAPEQELESWLNWLAEAPVAPTIPVLTRALRGYNPTLALAASERLVQFGQPLPTLVGILEDLRRRWRDEPGVLANLERMEGQSARVQPGQSVSLPAGCREPRLVVQWTLPETARNPFSPRVAQAWTKSLPHLEGLYVEDAGLYLLTTEALVILAPDGPPKVVSLPQEAAGFVLGCVAVGVGGDLLLGNGKRLYLWRPGADVIRVVEPSLGDPEDAPHQEILCWDGRHYGWSARVWKMSHYESDPGRYDDIAYRLDPEAVRLASTTASELQGMKPVRGIKLDTTNRTLPPLPFEYLVDGSYRVCSEEGLAVRCGDENPIHASCRASGKVAIGLEVFPSRLCRLYLWDRLSGKEHEKHDPTAALIAHIAAQAKRRA